MRKLIPFICILMDVFPLSSQIVKKASVNSDIIYKSPRQLVTPKFEVSELVFSGGFGFHENIFIKFNAQYPKDFSPKWAGKLPFEASKSQSFTSKAVESSQNTFVKFFKLDNTCVLEFQFDSCSVVCNLLNSNEKATIGEDFVTFQLSHFRISGEGKKDCQLNNNVGKWNGFLKAKALPNGDLQFELFQKFTSTSKSFLTQQWWIKEGKIPNIFTVSEAEKLLETRKKEQEAQLLKQNEERRKSQLASQTLQKKMDEIAKWPEAKPKTKLIYKGYKLKYLIELGRLLPDEEIAKFAQITFENQPETRLSAAMKKKVDKWIDVDEKSPLYIQMAQFVVFAEENELFLPFTPKAYEPHQVEMAFTRKYLLTNYLNKKMIEYAALVVLSDKNRMTQVAFGGLENDIYQIYPKEEITAIVDFLKSKK